MKSIIQFLIFICFYLCSSTFISAQTVITCGPNFESSVAILQPTRTHKTDSINFPIKIHYQVYEIALVNASQQTQNLILSIDDPNVHAVFVHEIDTGGDLIKIQNQHIQKVFKKLTFSTPITIGIQYYPKIFRVMVAQKIKTPTLQIRLSESNHFSQIFSRNLFIIGVYFGLLLIIFVYTLISFFSFKQTYFLWFSLLVFLLGVKVSIRTGIFPFATLLHHPDLDILVSTLVFVVFILFLQVLGDFKSRFPILNKVLIAIIVGRVLLNVTILALPQINWVNIEIYSRFGLLIALLIGIYLSFKQPQPNKWFTIAILLAFGFLILAGLIGSLFDLGTIQINYTTLGFWLAMVLSQILLFLWAISIQVNNIANEHIQLGIKMRKTKKDLIQAYITGVKTEKNHISKELQALVLDEIEAIKNDFQTNLPTDFEQNLNSIEKDLRNISNELRLEGQATFVEQLEQLVNQHQIPKTAFNFKSYNCTTELPSNTQKHLYRIIQEAFQNIEKYAQATVVEIQFYQRSNELFLTIEDNGIGFNQSAKTTGIGLENIKNRVQELKGKFELSTSLGQGVSILITIPITNE